MKKYIVILCALVFSCESKKESIVPFNEEVVLEHKGTQKVDSLLEMVDEFKESVDNVVEKKKNLTKKLIIVNEELVLVNDKLITAENELVKVKDCLEVAKAKIKEYKVPKKRSFFDKVLGTKKDSITVTDTIK
jgi:septal ring factor EnvC (AmiA/AmiB activator)